MEVVGTIVAGTAAMLWAGLWAYATLLVVFLLLEESDSLYLYPMRLALDRFVDTLGLTWLKSLHGLPLSRRRPLTFILFGFVSVGTTIMLVLLD